MRMARCRGERGAGDCGWRDDAGLHAGGLKTKTPSGKLSMEFYTGKQS